MLKYSTLFLTALLLSVQLIAQPYAKGHRTLTLNDPARLRDIPCHFYYPATTAGDNVALASGQFPFIVFGHGFSMGYDAYMNFVDELVPLGYIICLPTTEGGLSPNHETFGLDLKFLNNIIKTKGTSDPTFFLYQKITDRSAIMGHSMGGGASFLAAANNTNFTTLVNFAAAETSASAIAAASNVTVPVLMFIGEKDGVTPPNDHQIPMYNNVPPGCKGSITIKGGGHCYFANYNLACSTGELFTSPQPSISREAQHLAVFNALKPYLAWMLKGEGSQRQVFENVIAQSATYSSQFTCSVASINDFTIQAGVFPNPVDDILMIDLQNITNAQIELFSIEGTMVLCKPIQQNGESLMQIQMNELPVGVYILKIQTKGSQSVNKIIKQ